MVLSPFCVFLKPWEYDPSFMFVFSSAFIGNIYSYDFFRCFDCFCFLFNFDTSPLMMYGFILGLIPFKTILMP